MILLVTNASENGNQSLPVILEGNLYDVTAVKTYRSASLL